MYWKTFFLLTFIHLTLSFHEKWMELRKYHPHKALIEKTYDPKPIDVASDVDVGEPLILTPYIKSWSIVQARRLAKVDDSVLLPGVESYSGYLTVDEKYNSNLFFWFFPAKRAYVAPLILWLQGGPGASSLYGLFNEIGPFTVLDDGTLQENKYSWVQDYNLLFIDNPVGTGFSFTDEDGYAKNQTMIGEHLYIALQQFLSLFLELRSVPLYIAGESYAGKHIPSLAIQIHRNQYRDKLINLQGLMIGNGFIDPITLQRYSYFTREVGIVDDKTADRMKKMESHVQTLIEKGKTQEAFEVFGKLLQMITDVEKLPHIYNFLSDGTEINKEYTHFVQKPTVRRALHVGNITFARAHKVYSRLIPDIMTSAKPWLEELLEHYRVLLYSGQLDSLVPYHASVNTYKQLNYSGKQQYLDSRRVAWIHNKSLIGYYKKGGNLLEVMVRGAGHIVPLDKPAQALSLITAFIENIFDDQEE